MNLVKIGNRIINIDTLVDAQRFDGTGTLICNEVGGGKFILSGDDAEKLWKCLAGSARDLELEND